MAESFEPGVPFVVSGSFFVLRSRNFGQVAEIFGDRNFEDGDGERVVGGGGRGYEEMGVEIWSYAKLWVYGFNGI